MSADAINGQINSHHTDYLNICQYALYHALHQASSRFICLSFEVIAAEL